MTEHPEEYKKGLKSALKNVRKHIKFLKKKKREETIAKTEETIAKTEPKTEIKDKVPMEEPIMTTKTNFIQESIRVANKYERARIHELKNQGLYVRPIPVKNNISTPINYNLHPINKYERTKIQNEELAKKRLSMN